MVYKKEPMHIQKETGNVILKGLEEEYFSEYLKMLSLQIQRILEISSCDAEKQYLKVQLQKMKRNETFFYCIFEKETNQLFGAIEIRPSNHRSQLYNLINQSYWGNGYYQEALSLVLAYYFKIYLAEEKVTAGVDVSNKRSYKALLKAGFKELVIRKDPREDQYLLEFYR